MYPRIKNLQEDCDFTQQQLTEVLNTSQVTYSRYKSGTLDIPSSVLIALAKFYKTSIGYFLGQTDEKPLYLALKRKYDKNALP